MHLLTQNVYFQYHATTFKEKSINIDIGDTSPEIT